MASGSSRKKATLHDYMQRSSSSEKEKSRPRVQSGPLRHTNRVSSRGNRFGGEAPGSGCGFIYFSI